MTGSGTTSRLRGRLRPIGWTVVTVVIVLVFIEGTSSAILSGRHAAGVFRPLAERAHTRHDRELGWMAIAGFSEPDMYGPGVGLAINDQGFRHPGHVADLSAPDRSRVICAGGAFTFGAGVADDQTWCATLSRIDPRIESINMGQIGYGFDQSYLWYLRDGARLDQHIQLIAVTADGLERMRHDSWLSYDKPTLAVSNGALVTEHVPVPARSGVGARLRVLQDTAARSQTAVLIRTMLGTSGDRSDPALAPTPSAAPHDLVVRAALTAVADLHRSRGSLAVLVLLPTREDYADWTRDSWRDTTREAARGLVPVIDLVAELRARPAADVGTYFLTGEGSTGSLTAGQYSAAGHEFVARALHARLTQIPLAARQLQPARTP